MLYFTEYTSFYLFMRENAHNCASIAALMLIFVHNKVMNLYVKINLKINFYKN